MLMMVPQILTFADSWKTKKSKYLNNKTFFCSIKKIQ